MEQDNFEVRHPEIEAKLKELGHLIGDGLPPRFGFCLLLFEYGPDGAMFYIGSANRQDIINAMREFIKKNAEN